MIVSRNDVARAADVSPAVVSYVLNNGPRPVSAGRRERVLKAVEELGYRPNRVAASLRRRATHSLGLIVPDNLNPYFAELAREVELEAFSRGYTVLIGNAMDDSGREAAYVREFIDRRVDGIILIPTNAFVGTLPEIVVADIPLVIADRAAKVADDVPLVRSDNVAGARDAVTHLLEHGRRRVACVSAPAGESNGTDRVAGWSEALRGRADARGPVREAPISRFGGREAALSLLREDPAIDAIFVFSDEQAIGVLRALRELGMSCPQDIAVASFDGTSHAALTTPGLTTVRQPMKNMAALALDLLNVKSALDAPEQTELGLAVELIRRGSCGCPDDFDPHEPAAELSPTGGKRE